MFYSTNVPFDQCSIQPMFHSTNVPFDQCSIRPMFLQRNYIRRKCRIPNDQTSDFIRHSDVISDRPYSAVMFEGSSLGPSWCSDARVSPTPEVSIFQSGSSSTSLSPNLFPVKASIHDRTLVPATWNQKLLIGQIKGNINLTFDLTNFQQFLVLVQGSRNQSSVMYGGL